jgi:hypothetical protein
MVFSPLLPVHIAGGVVGILSGTAAMSFRKGSDRHAIAGKIFVAAMLIMAAAAVYLAFLKHQPTNVGGGVLTFYLIGTAWLTAKRKNGETSIFDWFALLIPLAIGVGAWLNGLQELRSHTEPTDGVPVGMNFFMGSVCLLAAAGDIRMLLGSAMVGVRRLVRHLWRMCFGLFIATGSFFLGQQQVFPVFLRNSIALLIPAILPLVLLIFWFVRVRFTKAYRKMPVTGGGAVYPART